MLTENAKFVSGAMSNVGAVGLMQVYPKIWLKALRDRFGSDLATDSTNLKYGIYILKQYVKSDSGRVTRGRSEQGPAALQRLRHGHEHAELQDVSEQGQDVRRAAGNVDLRRQELLRLYRQAVHRGLFGKDVATD